MTLISLIIGLVSGIAAVTWKGWCPNNELGFAIVVMLALVSVFAMAHFISETVPKRFWKKLEAILFD